MSSDTRESSGTESVLARWSRRKRETEQGADDGDAAKAAPAVAEETPQEAAVEAPPLTDADMPAIDSLDADSDFSPFMSTGVSEELRNLALRKLFHSPVFNIRDGLDEYDEDFTTFEKLGDIVTSDMKHQMEMQEQKLRDALQAEQEAADNAVEEEIELTEDSEIEDMADADNTEDQSPPGDADSEESRHG